MENCCSSYHTETKIEYLYDTRGNCVTYEHTIGKCWGTKECEECFCKGDRTNCDFYPDIRAKAEEASKGETPKTLKQKLSDIVDNALSELDVIKSNGYLDYDTYSEIHDIIGNIYSEFIKE